MVKIDTIRKKKATRANACKKDAPHGAPKNDTWRFSNLSTHESHDDPKIFFESVSNRNETTTGWDELCAKVALLISRAVQHLKSGRKVEAHRCITHANSMLAQTESMLEQQIIEEALPAIPSRLRE